MSALKPCPFCGEPAERDHSRGYVGYNGKHGNAVAIYCIAIYCCNCLADMSLCKEDYPGCNGEDLMAEVVEKWNRRVVVGAGGAK